MSYATQDGKQIRVNLQVCALCRRKNVEPHMLPANPSNPPVCDECQRAGSTRPGQASSDDWTAPEVLPVKEPSVFEGFKLPERARAKLLANGWDGETIIPPPGEQTVLEAPKPRPVAGPDGVDDDIPW